jgi:Holliday junction resolvase RusA-like endonuclease
MFLFEVYGNPVPQKQTRFVRRTGIAYDPSKKEKEQFQWQVRPYAPHEPLTCPIVLDLTFLVPIPQSLKSKVKRRLMANHTILPIKKPDIDNMAYLITNAMKKIFYEDDAQIVDMYLHKRYAEKPRTIVKILTMQEMEPSRGEECEQY